MPLLRVLGSVACTVLGVTGAVAGYAATAGGTGTAAPVVAAQETAVEQPGVRVSLRDCPDRLELRAGSCVRVVRRTVVTWVTPAAVLLAPSPTELPGTQAARPTRTPGPGPTPTASPSAGPSAPPSPTPPSPTPPAPTPSCPGGMPGAEPTGVATEPSDPPTASPSVPACPSASPSASPSADPSASPSASPSADPTETPSSTPSSSAEPTPARALTGR